MGKVWERPGRGHGSELFVFLVFPWFFAVWPKTSRTQKKSSDPWARSGLSTHKPKNKKTKNQKTKKTRNQKTKKPKKPKKQRLHTPRGGGQMQSVGSCLFVFLVFCFFVFLFFLGFWFFGLCVDSHCRCAKQRLPGTVSGCTRGRAGENQKTKKPKNQETKKPKKKTKKTRLHTPRGGGQMQSVGSCLFVFLFFLVFCFFGFLFFGLCVDSHCRCAKQRLPGTVSGCTRSKVDTLQYSNVCYDIVHSANEQQRGMEFNFVRLRHMLLDLCTGNAAICALPQWPVLKFYGSGMSRGNLNTRRCQQLVANAMHKQFETLGVSW